MEVLLEVTEYMLTMKSCFPLSAKLFFPPLVSVSNHSPPELLLFFKH